MFCLHRYQIGAIMSSSLRASVLLCRRLARSLALVPKVNSALLSHTHRSSPLHSRPHHSFPHPTHPSFSHYSTTTRTTPMTITAPQQKLNTFLDESKASGFLDAEFAAFMDDRDPLKALRNEFVIPKKGEIAPGNIACLLLCSVSFFFFSPPLHPLTILLDFLLFSNKKQDPTTPRTPASTSAATLSASSPRPSPAMSKKNSRSGAKARSTRISTTALAAPGCASRRPSRSSPHAWSAPRRTRSPS